MTVSTESVTEQKGQESAPEALNMLQPATTHFRLEASRLQMRLDGEEDWRAVTLARLFPLSEPEGWIAVIDKDGKEIGVLVELRGLSRESLAAARAELHRRYMIPEIARILACHDRYDLLEWEVETNRGLIRFLMRHPQENIQQTLPGRYMLTDVEGNRYDIPDINTLDRESYGIFTLRL